jgi:hypothetical protein
MVKAITAGLTIIESVALTDALVASVTLMEKLDVPARSGEPDTLPVDWSSVSPSGRFPD